MNWERTDFGWKHSGPTFAHAYLSNPLLNIIRSLYRGKAVKILDVGCGNGYITSRLAELGHSVVGIDVSQDGIDIARSTYPHIQFYACSLYESKYKELVDGFLDCVISIEVMEHLYYPRSLFRMSYQLLKPGGYLIVSTPYHGYLKNLALSLLNGWDRHFEVDMDGGHIKFFSKNTLSSLAQEAGFNNNHFQGVGRFPCLWKSMIMVFKK